jgi:hypothetical protein
VLCELDADTNFEILAERGCEKQQAALRPGFFLLCFSTLRLTGIPRLLIPAVLD